MLLQIFARDIVPIISMVIAAVGLLFIWLQIRAATKAFRQSSRWQKISATYNFFSMERNSEIEKQLYPKAAEKGVKLNSRLSDEELELIVGDPELFLYSKNLLNDFESYCAAYRLGALDKELAFQLLGTRVTHCYGVFVPFVEYLRKAFKDPGVLYEFEATAREWAERLRDEEAKRVEILNLSQKGVEPDHEL